jgi:hypothetical protein
MPDVTATCPNVAPALPLDKLSEILRKYRKAFAG